MPTPQKPIHSGFGPATTAEEIIRDIDLTGKVAIVTGGYAGLGLETTRVLSSAGATVIVPARDREKAASALETMPGVELEPLDLMDPDSIDDFAERFVASGRPLDILVNNAGIMVPPLARDARGYESQFSTNHLGHFQLTAGLWPALRRAGAARVVCLSSRGHHFSGMDFDDPNFERRAYEPWIGYGQSKSANILFAVALDRLGAPHGVRAFALHPGGIITDLVRHLPAEWAKETGYMDGEGRPIIDPQAGKKTVEQGAATSVWCATSRQLDGLGGVYCENCDIATVAPADSTERFGVKSWATDPELADLLWEMSERLTGKEFRA